MAHIIHDRDAVPGPELGGKATALAALRGAGLAIPPWFVITADAFHASLTNAQRKVLTAIADNGGGGRDVQELIEELEPRPELRHLLEPALRRLCPDGAAVAVRSSAADEDGAQQSFAGQLDSFLFVAPEDVPDRIAAVWRSGFGGRLVAYRRAHGLGLLPGAPAVIVQRMINAEVSGVATSADPVSGRRSVAVVGAVYGLGTALVSGEADADTFHVDARGEIAARVIVCKRVAHHRAPGRAAGVEVVAVAPERATAPSLADREIRAVAELARRAERHFGRPQDIEWAFQGGQLYLLQARPLTALAQLPDPEGAVTLWDNSNIAESYSGITTPLTFSFARRAYREVYSQFCRLMGVPATTMVRNHDVFERMLGLVRGRVYYNLLSWYRLLAMLPGFPVTRRFMEQMMGVSRSLPESLVRQVGDAARPERLRDRLSFVVMVGRLSANHLFLGRRIARFTQRLDEGLGSRRPDLSGLRADELVAHYRELERKLLMGWDAPLINDFLAMIFHGLWRRAATAWCGDTDGALSNALLCGQGGLISAVPAARVAEMARSAAECPGLIALLCEGDLADILAELPRHSTLATQYRAYVDAFGDRCVDELKLESPTLEDDPLMLFRSVGQLARQSTSPAPPNQAFVASGPMPEDRARAALAGHPLRRLAFRWVLKNARARVRDRENLRFERTRVFGRARMIFLELGRRLYACDALDEPRDIFYLEVEEMLGFVEGTISATNLRGLAALRKAEWARYRLMSPPADRFETYGIVHQGNAFAAPAAAAQPDGEERRGIGCCPGRVRGRVRVVADPRRAELRAGEVLVATQTDPGWIMLFPLASGLVVERGSLLSHSAIVSRELGIPSVISLSGATQWLSDGDWVELDGGAGTVRKLNGHDH